MTPKFLVFLNTSTFIFTILINYLSSTGKLNGVTVGSISDKYPSLLTPSGFAFSIWGFIYLCLLLFITYQWYLIYKKCNTSSITQMGVYFALSNLANAGWILLWVHEMIPLSLAMIFFLLFTLIVLVLRLNMEKWDAPLYTIFFVWWPICLYLGWIVIASVVNVAATLVYLGWDGAPLSPVYWTMACIFVACFIYLLLIKTRNLREAALVGIWGIFGIVYKQWDQQPLIAYAGVAAIFILFSTILVHAFRNRYDSPWQKWKRGEIK